MRIIKNNFIPFKGFSAINLFGLLFVKRNVTISSTLTNHEKIHSAQWKELWYIGFLLWYIIEWAIRLPKGNAYRNISFEREAYENDSNLQYLETRKRFAFVRYLKNNCSIMRNILSLFLFSLLITSCNQKQSDSSVHMSMVEESAILDQQTKYGSPELIDEIEKQEVIKKKIIRDGRIGVRVLDIENAKSRIDTLILHHGGYYANEHLNNTDKEISYNLIIRIPSENLMKCIYDIESGDGEILYKEIDARDVTDQFIDLETRLENKRNYLNRYNDLLLKANSIKEILDIEEKIRVLEEEIDSTTGILKYLNDLVDYSTLVLTISKQRDFKYNPAKQGRFSEKIKQSLYKGWFGFVEFLLFIIKVWPFWIIITLIFYLWNNYRTRRKRK